MVSRRPSVACRRRARRQAVLRDAFCRSCFRPKAPAARTGVTRHTSACVLGNRRWLIWLPSAAWRSPWTPRVFMGLSQPAVPQCLAASGSSRLSLEFPPLEISWRFLPSLLSASSSCRASVVVELSWCSATRWLPLGQTGNLGSEGCLHREGRHFKEIRTVIVCLYIRAVGPELLRMYNKYLKEKIPQLPNS